MAAPLTLSSSAARAFARLSADVQRVFGARFVALAAYGPADSLAFAETVAAGDLDACGALVETWHREGLATPLVLTPDEFRRSLDAFPLEYQAIMDRHVLVAGRDPFGGCRVDRQDLRRACEIQARGHLIHLRQGWMEAGSHAHALGALVVRSAAPLRALLSNVAALHGAPAATDADLSDFAAREAAMPAGVVVAVLALEHAGHDAEPGAAALLPEYLEASERLWRFVDAWKSRRS